MQLDNSNVTAPYVVKFECFLLYSQPREAMQNINPTSHGTVDFAGPYKCQKMLKNILDMLPCHHQPIIHGLLSYRPYYVYWFPLWQSLPYIQQWHSVISMYLWYDNNPLMTTALQHCIHPTIWLPIVPGTRLGPRPSSGANNPNIVLYFRHNPRHMEPGILSRYSEKQKFLLLNM